MYSHGEFHHMEDVSISKALLIYYYIIFFEWIFVVKNFQLNLFCLWRKKVQLQKIYLSVCLSVCLSIYLYCKYILWICTAYIINIFRQLLCWQQVIVIMSKSVNHEKWRYLFKMQVHSTMKKSLWVSHWIIHSTVPLKLICSFWKKTLLHVAQWCTTILILCILINLYIAYNF